MTVNHPCSIIKIITQSSLPLRQEIEALKHLFSHTLAMKIQFTGFFILIFLCFLFFLPSVSQSQNYRMGPDDVLEISVFGHPDMTTTVRVDGQGKIIFPLIGQVNAAGLTTDQLSRQIASRLADGYLINPQVNVFVKEFREQKAVILGQVTHPGLYKLRPQTTLLEMISQAGGLTKEAGSKAILKRTIKGEDEKNKVVQQSIDLDRLINEGDTSLNISIQDGDNIFFL